MQDGSKDSSAQSDVSKVLGDQSFMSSILSSVSLVEFAFLNPIISFCFGYLHSDAICLLQLPGVDPNDPNVKDLLASLPGQSEVCFINLSIT